jgi:hypothetical protein
MMTQFDDITEDLTEVIGYASHSKEMSASTPTEVTMLKPVPSVPISLESFREDLIVVEPSDHETTHSIVYLLLLSPHYPTPFYIHVRRYFREVRQRMIDSRDYDRLHYSHRVRVRGTPCCYCATVVRY